FDLPVIIHSRGAWRDCLKMTKDAGVSRAVFHWYSGPLDVLEEIIDAGYYVGTTPSLACPQFTLARLKTSDLPKRSWVKRGCIYLIRKIPFPFEARLFPVFQRRDGFKPCFPRIFLLNCYQWT
ncbi:MAG: TatD family hydrolase, partial [Planctomycetota bacterium]